MRIIRGQAAAAILKVPRGLRLRPTPDRVRQAVFNSLGNRVCQARVLDLFAGTAALGIECLSRGSREVVGVELSPAHAKIIRENLARTGMSPAQYHLRVQDVFTALRQFAAGGERFDLILADPPYGEKNIGRRSNSDAQALLDDPDLLQLMAPEGLLVLGHARRDTLASPPAWIEVKRLKNGDSIMRFLQPRQAGAPAPALP